MAIKYEALGQNVFVKELKEEEKVGGFVIPDTLDNDMTRGQVVYSSSGYYDHGMFVSLSVYPGDIVLFPKISGTKVTLGGEKLIRVYASDIIVKEMQV